MVGLGSRSQLWPAVRTAYVGALVLFVITTVIAPVDRIVLGVVNLGLIGFATGLITTTQVLKRISAPVMGVALLIGVGMYMRELWGVDVERVTAAP